MGEGRRYNGRIHVCQSAANPFARPHWQNTKGERCHTRTEELGSKAWTR